MVLQCSGYTGCIFHRAVLIMVLQCSDYTGCIFHRVPVHRGLKQASCAVQWKCTAVCGLAVSIKRPADVGTYRTDPVGFVERSDGRSKPLELEHRLYLARLFIVERSFHIACVLLQLGSSDNTVTDISRWVLGEVRQVSLVWGVPTSSGPLCHICGGHRLLFPRQWSGLNVNLTAHLHPVPMARNKWSYVSAVTISHFISTNHPAIWLVVPGFIPHEVHHLLPIPRPKQWSHASSPLCDCITDGHSVAFELYIRGAGSCIVTASGFCWLVTDLCVFVVLLNWEMAVHCWRPDGVKGHAGGRR